MLPVVRLSVCHNGNTDSAEHLITPVIGAIAYLVT